MRKMENREKSGEMEGEAREMLEEADKRTRKGEEDIEGEKRGDGKGIGEGSGGRSRADKGGTVSLTACSLSLPLLSPVSLIVLFCPYCSIFLSLL